MLGKVRPPALEVVAALHIRRQTHVFSKVCFFVGEAGIRGRVTLYY